MTVWMGGGDTNILSTATTRLTQLKRKRTRTVGWKRRPLRQGLEKFSFLPGLTFTPCFTHGVRDREIYLIYLPY